MFRAVRNRRGEHSARFREWTALIEPTYLRDGLIDAAPSPSGWYQVRQRFTNTTAAMCGAGYVLGVGDRHLQNFLIDKVTGDNIAIDFGHAFGSATTTLAIPELIPFRMTPQMVAALGVLGTDAVAPGIEQTLAAMQRHRATITSLLAVFLDEPLSGWEGRRLPTTTAKPGAFGGGGDAAAPGSGSADSSDTTTTTAGRRAALLSSAPQVTDLARRKVQSVYRKLAMEHPVKLLEDELAVNPHVERMKVLPDIHRVVEGEPVKREGATRLASAAEQTRLLLSLATDENILGRTWVGWAPLF